MKKDVIEEQSINDVNYELLKKQFPHAVSIDENGKYVIDPQKLQMSLDPSLAQIKEDGYGLNWVGKKEAYHNAFTKNYKVLKPLKDDSKNWDETENILIKGDNLDALKILRQNYFESIKMIYIDPPYNTENDEFVYNDNFTTSTEQTLEELGYNEEYIDYIENIQGAKTHSGWLSFMYPRLLLAKDLLKDDGVIFISIDDNEAAQLKILCDEVFGEENFIKDLIVNTSEGGGQAKYVVNGHEYLYVYAKDIMSFDNLKRPKDIRGKKIKIDDELYWIQEDAIRKEFGKYGNLHYEEILEYRDEKFKEKIDKGIQNNEYTLVKKDYGMHIIGKLRKLSDDFSKFHSILNIDNINKHLTADGIKELESIFEAAKGESPFSNPKPLELIKRVILSSTFKPKEDDIVLDFFGGSGTTAHAIMELNSQDNGNRKYILVQLPELINESKSKAAFDLLKKLRKVQHPEIKKEDELLKKYPLVIFDITKARIDKAGVQIAKGDIGFRIFEIVEDQKQKIYQKSLENINQDDIDNLLKMMEKPDIEKNEEILYNLFIAETLPLSTKHQELIKDRLYLASNVAFILGDITSDELVEALKDKKECEYITVYSPNISNDKFTLEIESNISKLGIKSDKLRFRG
ncbi:site-specific DNA-methyltransferase [Aliarcobacter cryaerophilus]|uniref:site-specific DNA-methyltransferase n=1 Tax=Aliarcobacter cryaerophilus TaxID=28198 RepID=UPI0021B3E20B|nr:site-specific DNA-methyltransferase [Aliarcobacter cryaerophilus]MCT7468939.1 site-specific DNA-methyltransferase [Aliarcobacter cryaerophilus]